MKLYFNVQNTVNGQAFKSRKKNYAFCVRKKSNTICFILSFRIETIVKKWKIIITWYFWNCVFKTNLLNSLVPWTIRISKIDSGKLLKISICILQLSYWILIFTIVWNSKAALFLSQNNKAISYVDEDTRNTLMSSAQMYK